MADDTLCVETTVGTFTVELYSKQAPKACKNFSELYAPCHTLIHPLMLTADLLRARRGYYDGVSFHRVIKDFMAQENPEPSDPKQHYPPPTFRRRVATQQEQAVGVNQFGGGKKHQYVKNNDCHTISFVWTQYI